MSTIVGLSINISDTKVSKTKVKQYMSADNSARQISNESFWRDTGQAAVIKELRRLKWKCIDHALRKPHSLEWNPQGSQRKGRPSNTWRRKVTAEVVNLGYFWNERISALVPKTL